MTNRTITFEVDSQKFERNISIYWNLLKIPLNLDCLKDCKGEFEKDIFISNFKEIPGISACANRKYKSYVGEWIGKLNSLSFNILLFRLLHRLSKRIF